MIEKLLNYLEDKKILILGFGKEGESSYKLIRKHFPEKNLFIADKNMNLLNEKIELMEDPYLEVSLGENYLNGIEEYDLIIKAPGISLKDVDLTNIENKITSQLELFFEYTDVYKIGITGTKGKSTTSSLMYKVLIDQGKASFLLGNIGEPIFNYIELIENDSIVVLELSSHALEFVKRSPNIAILLDIYEEHLDHYKSFERYIEAKFDPTYDETKNIFNDATKLMGGNRHGTSSEKRVTLDLADDYYQIASESSYNYSKDEKGKQNPAHDDVKKWHYFVNDIYFAEYDSEEYAPYRVTINVKEKLDGEYVYSFSAEKQRESDTPRTLHAVVNGGNNPDANVKLSNNRLTRNKPIVKNNISREGEKYSSDNANSKHSVASEAFSKKLAE